MEPPMREVDHATPFRIPEGRPLNYREQIELWQDALPESLRAGSWPGDKDRDVPAWDKLRERHRAALDRWGWLLNRLDWDREWTGPTEGCYHVPACCKPGGQRMPRAKLARLRREAQGTPAFTPQGMANFGALSPEDLGWEAEPF